MGIAALIGFVLLGLIIYGPQMWVRNAISRHNAPRPDLPGSGGELAQHLISHFNIDQAQVESTDAGDHYDPKTRTVRLLDSNLKGKSITAVAIAAHEVGHAIQHFEGNKLLSLRQYLVRIAQVSDRFAAVFFVVAPMLGVLVRSPAAFFGIAAIGLLLMSVRVIVHLVTLPVEWDASFNKALPILEQGGYLHPDDLPAARQVLRAAALTYVSAALVSLLNLARWIRILR